MGLFYGDSHVALFMYRSMQLTSCSEIDGGLRPNLTSYYVVEIKKTPNFLNIRLYFFKLYTILLTLNYK